MELDCIAEVLHWIALYHTGVAPPGSTYACRPAAKDYSNALTDTDCWQCSVQPQQTSCYTTQRQKKPQHVLESLTCEQYNRADVFSGQRHHALACGSLWVWWRLHWLRRLLNGASQPLIGQSLFIPPQRWVRSKQRVVVVEMELPPLPRDSGEVLLWAAWLKIEDQGASTRHVDSQSRKKRVVLCVASVLE